MVVAINPNPKRPKKKTRHKSSDSPRTGKEIGLFFVCPTETWPWVRKSFEKCKGNVGEM